MDCSPQTSLLMGFSSQEYCSGLSFLSPGDLSDPRIEPRSPTLKADSLLDETPGKPSKLVYLHLKNDLLVYIFSILVFTFLKSSVSIVFILPYKYI